MASNLTKTEENYLKAIFKVSEKNNKPASTNALSKQLNTTPASVSDMLKKLAEKELILYQKYKGVQLTGLGSSLATNLIRKHRLWEVFLVEKLRFSWDQVHDIAEELEHIKSDELVARLDAYLDYPKFDPHGDPIPNAEGKFTIRNQFPLSSLPKGHQAQVVGVRTQDKKFLQYLNDLHVKIGSIIQVERIVDFDQSMEVLIQDKTKAMMSHTTAQNILMKRV